MDLKDDPQHIRAIETEWQDVKQDLKRDEDATRPDQTSTCLPQAQLSTSQQSNKVDLTI